MEYLSWIQRGRERGRFRGENARTGVAHRSTARRHSGRTPMGRGIPHAASPRPRGLSMLHRAQHGHNRENEKNTEITPPRH